MMDGKILVAYASKYGSTREVAEAVAEALRASGRVVEVQPMRMVNSLDGYAVVVVGAPLYFGAWHSDALGFLGRLQEALAQRRVAVFALGPIGPGEDERQAAREMLESELAKFPWLSPAAVSVFGGTYTPAKLGLFHRLVASLPASPLHGLPASDERDWAAIRDWAATLVGPLAPARAM